MKYFLIGLLLHTGICYAQSNSKTIVAEGQAKVKIKPDIAILSLSVGKSDTSEAMVMQALNKTVQALSAILDQQGISKKQIKIADYSLSHSTYGEGNKKTYALSNTLKVELHVQEAVINQLLTAIEVQKLSDLAISFEYRLSDSLEKKTRMALVQQAIADAKANAMNIARALQVQLKHIKQVGKKGDASALQNANNEYTRYTPPITRKVVNLPVGSSFQHFEIEEIDLYEEIIIIYEI